MTDLESQIKEAFKQKGCTEVMVKIENGHYVVLAVCKKIIGKTERPTK